MNTVLKDKLLVLKEAIKDIDGKIEIGKHKVKVQQNYINQLEEDKKKRESDVQSKIDESHAEIANVTIQLETLQTNYAAFNTSVADSTEQAKKKTELNSLYKNLIDRIQKAKNEIDFYEEHDNCPTCSQTISDDLKATTVEKHTHKINEVNGALEQINEKITVVESRLDEIEGIKHKMSEIQVEILRTNNNIIASQNYIKKLMTDLEQKDDSLSSLITEKVTLKGMAKEIVDYASERTKLNEDKFYHEAAGSLLKDTGIKTKIIRQYLPVINKMVNKYLTSMDFFVHFELDESFNESIKSRHRDEFSYASFSEGEKQRIDLALLFTWRTIAKMKNSASTNLLLLDEVFDSSLDANGTDYVMNLLNTIGDDTNVFVISHKGDQLIDKFKSVIKFQKYQNFSRIV